MAKVSNREKILDAGLKVVHEHGFGAASVRDIVQAAGVPQGSFTNHFGSKEMFGLAILERYWLGSQALIVETLRNEALPPLGRLKAYLLANKNHLSACEMRNGCLYGNFSAEVVEQSEPIRLRLLEIFEEVGVALADCLRAAVKSGDLPKTAKVDALAKFIHSSFQGAILVSKAERSPAAVENFEKLLFTTVLKSPA